MNSAIHNEALLKNLPKEKKQNLLWREILVNAKELSSQEKKKVRAEMHLVYGIHDTPFGKCLVGVCEEGICHHCCPNVFVQVLGNCLITHIKSATMGCSDLKCKNQFQMIFVPINTVGGKYHEYRDICVVTIFGVWFL